MGNKTQSRSKIRFGINSPITELFQENFAETSSSKTQKDFHHHLKAISLGRKNILNRNQIRTSCRTQAAVACHNQRAHQHQQWHGGC